MDEVDDVIDMSISKEEWVGLGNKWTTNADLRAAQTPILTNSGYPNPTGILGTLDQSGRGCVWTYREMI